MIRSYIIDYQSGLKKNESTDTCLSVLNDKRRKCFDSNLLTGMILIDLQKEFGTINHYILLRKVLLVFLITPLHGFNLIYKIVNLP